MTGCSSCDVLVAGGDDVRLLLDQRKSMLARLFARRRARSRESPVGYLHDCSDCFRLERLPGGACTHWKAPPLHGAHPIRTLPWNGLLSGSWAARACKATEGLAVLYPRPGSRALAKLSIARHQIMIRNGLYLAETRFLDGVEAYNRHVMVLRDGTMRGGGGYYYTVGSNTCSDSKWKGEVTSRDHSHISGTYPWARKTISWNLFG
jgi:hypothetical protein